MIRLPRDADRRAGLDLVPVSRETEQRLATYVERLRDWQRIKNLVAPSTLDHLWTRHIADSAQLVHLAPMARRWVDFGSGAGFPGLVIALLLAEQPHMRVDLIESNARKCAFLRDVIRATAAPAVVHAGRIEDVVPTLAPGVEVVTSRALAPVADLIGLGRSLLDCGAVGLFLTGETVVDSLAGLETLAYEVTVSPSRTHGAARIVRVVAQRPAERPEASSPPGP